MTETDSPPTVAGLESLPLIRAAAAKAGLGLVTARESNVGSAADTRVLDEFEQLHTKLVQHAKATAPNRTDPGFPEWLAGYSEGIEHALEVMRLKLKGTAADQPLSGEYSGGVCDDCTAEISPADIERHRVVWQERDNADDPDATVRVCIDAHCPNCGHPERWANVTPDLRTVKVYGCRKCSYRSAERER